jgi:negative regulator of flagellin synthesis FlgM
VNDYGAGKVRAVIISRSEINHVLCAYSNQAVPAAKGPAGAGGGLGRGPADAVDLSARAREMDRLRQAIAALPDVRPERVARVARAIADGTYQVRDDDVAEKMLGRSVVDGIA